MPLTPRAGCGKMVSNSQRRSSNWNVETHSAADCAMNVSRAEAKLLERIRSCQHATMIMVHVGGDGEPKLLFAYEDVKREDLTR